MTDAGNVPSRFENGGSSRVPSRPGTLGDLFLEAGVSLPGGADAGLEIAGVADDSRAVVEGGVFLAVRGEVVDGHRFIQAALEKGAALVIAEAIPDGVDDRRVLCVPDTRSLRGPLAQAAWGSPGRSLDVIGVTGTNGKTTTAYLVESLLRQAGRRPGLFGTVEYRFEDYHEPPPPTTTPGAFHLARSMARVLELGADSVVMEVSSHALAQGRVNGIPFRAGLMTNLTQDHLDFHHSMEEYAEAKHLLFTRHRPDTALFNLDDPTARRFADLWGGERRVTYGLNLDFGPDVSARSLDLREDGITMALTVRGGGDRGSVEIPLKSPLRGLFNASNLLAAAAIGLAMEIEPATIVSGLGAMPGAPGRFEAVRAGQPFGVYVDYAHTPDAVERILENARPITAGRLIVLLGCGGDRDPAKRPLMGAAMGRLADHSVITTDNPRSESPADIARAMEEGLLRETPSASYEIELDRREAIRRAVEMARPGDTVVIAGKGHEDYQEVAGVKRHFDDREMAREFCRALHGNAEGGAAQ